MTLSASREIILHYLDEIFSRDNPVLFHSDGGKHNLHNVISGLVAFRNLVLMK